MRYFIFLFSLLTSFPILSFAQLDLSIEISPLRNNKGKLLLEFKSEKDELVKGISEDISNNKCTIVIKNLEPGRYAFKYFHDENNDEKMTTNFMGIPREGFGFSNNAKGTFGPPSFEKMIFELTKSDTVKCIPNYMLKQK